MKKLQIYYFLFCIVSVSIAGKTTKDALDPLWENIHKKIRLNSKLNKDEILFYQRNIYKSTEPFFSKEFSKSILLRKYQRQFMPCNSNVLTIGIVGSSKKLELSPLAILPQLGGLIIYGRNVNFSGIPKDIKFLFLSKVNAKSLATLPNMTNVKFIYLSKITDKVNWSDFFAKFPNLKILGWRSPPEEIKLETQFLPKLEFLIIRRFNKISLSPDLELKGLALSLCQNTCLPDFQGIKLEELIIKNSSKLKDYSSISSLTNLKRLIINKTPLNNLDFLKGMKLEYLDIRETPASQKPIPKWLNAKKILK